MFEESTVMPSVLRANQEATSQSPANLHMAGRMIEPMPFPPPELELGSVETLPGMIRVGHASESLQNRTQRKGAELKTILNEQVPADTLLTFEPDVPATIIILEVNIPGVTPTNEFLAAAAYDICPPPDIWWRAHGMELTLVYLGDDHDWLAMRAGLCASRTMQATSVHEIRHPRSESTEHPGASCGELHFPEFDDRREIYVSGQSPSTLREARLNELKRLGLGSHGLHNHRFCPLAASSDSTAGDCVVVLQNSIFCPHCAAQGITHNPDLPPGVYPLACRMDVQAPLKELVENWVHWTQAQIILRGEFPFIPVDRLKTFYRMALQRESYPDNPRTAMVFNPANNLLLTKSGWICSDTGTSVSLSSDACAALPYCIEAFPEEKDGKQIWRQSVIKERRAALRDGRALGYPKVQPVTGLQLGEPEPGVYRYRTDMHSPFPAKLLAIGELLPEDECRRILDAEFPGLSHQYLSACLCAAICAESGASQPPMVVVNGPSGSGKTITPMIAAGFLDDVPVKLEISPDPEKFNRSIGAAVESGKRFLLIDELARTQDLFKRLGSLLQISSRIDWRPLYANGNISTKCRAGFFFTSISLPEFLEASSEFDRRVRTVRLDRRARNWAASCGGNAEDWRHHSARNAQVADSMVARVLQLCTEHRFNFDAVADALELGHVLSDGSGPDKGQLLRALYDYICFGGEGRLFHPASSRFSRGWVNVQADAKARELLDTLVPLEGDGNPGKAMKELCTLLKSEAWNELLGFDTPRITCSLKIHGRLYGLRFSETGVKKGGERVNDELPRAAAGSQTTEDVLR